MTDYLEERISRLEEQVQNLKYITRLDSREGYTYHEMENKK